jgi:hypothetical protein
MIEAACHVTQSVSALLNCFDVSYREALPFRKKCEFFQDVCHATETTTSAWF